MRNRQGTSLTLLLLTTLLAGCNAQTREGSAPTTQVTLHTGPNSLPAGPLCLTTQTFDKNAPYIVETTATDPVAAQADEKGRLWWWTQPYPPQQHVICTIRKRAEHPAPRNVHVQQVADDRINVTMAGNLLTAFNFKKNEAKPYLYPVIGPTGAPVTRDYPMKNNPDEKKNKRQDHPHHRSIWTGYGDLRTTDFTQPGSNYWQEIEKADRQQVKRIIRITSGPVFGQIEAEIEWRRSEDGIRELTEYRTYTFFKGDDTTRIIDIQNVFRFTDGNVMFADTKEGGILALRVATTIDEKNKGTMCNANNQVGEKQCWGQRAAWCDYVGTINGQTVGIAVFDAPTNFHHPTYWHIRSYGLYAANPFGTRHFTKTHLQDQAGSHTWQQGQTATFNYRIIIHKGDTQQAQIADHWHLYSTPPFTDPPPSSSPTSSRSPSLAPTKPG